jgi:hypothetical protein
MNTTKTILLMLILAFIGAGCSIGSDQTAPTAVVTQVAELVDAKLTIEALEKLATEALPSNTSVPTQTPLLTATPTLEPTNTATAVPKTCLELIYPPNGEWVRAYGYLNFRWEPWEGAESYRLEITVPTGWVMSVDLDDTKQNRYMPTLASEGEYIWRVTALDPEGELICQSLPFTFKKQYSRPNIDVGDNCDEGVLASGT